MSRAALIVLLVLAIAAGFGAGWVTYDATHSATSTVDRPSACRQYDILDPARCIRR
jgi:hypothetical protein